MRDPHVVNLKYVLKTDSSTAYRSPPPVHVVRDDFELTLDGGSIVCRMLEHYASVDEARRVVEPFLRAWELKTALALGPGEVMFEYLDAEVIDRNPPPPGATQVLLGSAGVVATAGLSGTLHVTRVRYPDPPTDFVVTPDVETLWQRYNMYQQGREPLPAMAYFCLTVVERSAGSRKDAAVALRIDPTALSKLGELTTQRGDAATARKAPRGKSFAALTPREATWIEAMIKLLIQRLGHAAAGTRLRQVGMRDLPAL